MDLQLTATEDLWQLFELRGDLTCRTPSAEEAKVLEPLGLKTGPDRHVVLNMQHATFLDSSGIGWLLSLNRVLRQKNLRLVLYALPPIIERVVSMMRLDEAISVLPDLQKVKDHLSSLNP
jgi:anti-anti-sigma factor